LDIEKLLKWKELAQNYYGKDFWSGIFDGDTVNKVMPDLSEFFDQAPQQKTNNPKADIWMNQNEIVVVIELPGLTKEEIYLTINGNQLRIEGQINNQYKEYTEIARERLYGHFEKIIQLPEFVRREQSKAQFTNGILVISFARIQKANNEKIKIE